MTTPYRLLEELEETTTTTVLDTILIKYVLRLRSPKDLEDLTIFLDSVRYVFYVNRIDLTESNLHNLSRLDSIKKQYEDKVEVRKTEEALTEAIRLGKRKKTELEESVRNTRSINMFLGVALTVVVGLAVAIGFNETKYIKPSKSFMDRVREDEAKLFVSVQSGHDTKEVVKGLYKLSREYKIEPQGTYKFYIHPNGDVNYISGNPLYSAFIMKGLYKHRRVAERTLVVVRFK